MSSQKGNVLERANMVLVFIGVILLTAMSFMIVVDVLLRFIFNQPLPASVEVSELVLPYAIFFPMAYTLVRGQHVRVTLFVELLPKMIQKFTDLFVYLVATLFCALVTYYSWIEFQHSFAIGEIMLAAIKLPWWSGKFAMPVGMFVITIQCLLLLVNQFSKIMEKE